MKVYVVMWTDSYSLKTFKGVFSSILNAKLAYPELDKDSGYYMVYSTLDLGAENFALTTSQSRIQMCLDHGELCTMSRKLLEQAIENDWSDLT